MIDDLSPLIASPLIISVMTFVIGYLLGERQERRRIGDAADEVRRTMEMLRERMDRPRAVSPDDDAQI